MHIVSQLIGLRCLNSTVRIVAHALFATCLIAQVVGCSSGEGGGASPSIGVEAETGSPSAAPSESDVSITAEEFAEAFKADTDAANERFLNKTVELTGTVESVGAFSYPAGFVYLAGIKLETKHERPWEKVLPGQTVTLRGLMEIGGTPMDIVNVGGERLTVSADDLTKAYLSDPTATDEKYLGKWLEVQGEVAVIEQPEAESASIYLVSTNEISVRCRLNYDRNDFAEQLKVGDMVRVAGSYRKPENTNEVLIWGCLECADQ